MHTRPFQEMHTSKQHASLKLNGGGEDNYEIQLGFPVFFISEIPRNGNFCFVPAYICQPHHFAFDCMQNTQFFLFASNASVSCVIIVLSITEMSSCINMMTLEQ